MVFQNIKQANKNGNRPAATHIRIKKHASRSEGRGKRVLIKSVYFGLRGAQRAGRPGTKTGSAAELAVVVAGVGDPHFEHVDRVVEVSDPAFTREVEVTGFTLLKEDVPVLGGDGKLDADGAEILLDGLRNRLVAGVLVDQVLDGVSAESLPSSNLKPADSRSSIAFAVVPSASLLMAKASK